MQPRSFSYPSIEEKLLRGANEQVNVSLFNRADIEQEKNCDGWETGSFLHFIWRQNGNRVGEIYRGFQANTNIRLIAVNDDKSSSKYTHAFLGHMKCSRTSGSKTTMDDELIDDGCQLSKCRRRHELVASQPTNQPVHHFAPPC